MMIAEPALPNGKSYRFQFYVPDGIVERMRILSPRHEFAYKQDLEVAEVVDQRLQVALTQGQVAAVVDGKAPEEVTVLYKITVGSSGQAIAIARRISGPNPPSRCPGGAGRTPFVIIGIVTTLTARNAVEHKQWRAATDSDVMRLARILRVGDAPDVRSELEETKEEEKEMSEQMSTSDNSKPSRGGTTMERVEYAKSILRARPKIPTHGADGLSEAMKNRFGVGIGQNLAKQLREQVALEKGGGVGAAPTPPQAPAATASRPPLDAARNLPALLAAEQVARRAMSEASKNLAAAERAVKEALAQIEASREQR